MNATPFAARLAAVMVAVVLAAASLTVMLDYLKFRRVVRTQEDLVYAFVANDLVSTIEDSLNLGLSLATLQTTEQVIQRRRAAEQGTLSISVFDSTGVVLFDTDRYRIGSQLPAALAPPDPSAEWRAERDDAFVVGARIINSFDQPAGGVVVRYDPAVLEARIRAILLDMIRAAMAAVGVTAVVAIVAAQLLTRRMRVWFGRATTGVTALAAAPLATMPVGGAGALLESIDQTRAALDEAEAALIRLGTGQAEPAIAA